MRAKGTKAELTEYIEAMRNALRSAAARQTYFPMDAQLRRDRNMALARDTGVALRGFDPAAVKHELGGLYGSFIVSNSLDSCGVQIDAKEFIAQVNLRLQAE